MAGVVQIILLPGKAEDELPQNVRGINVVLRLVGVVGVGGRQVLGVISREM